MLILLHRKFQHSIFTPDLLLLQVDRFTVYPWMADYWLYLGSIGAACMWAIWKRDRPLLGRIQLYALALGLFFTHHGLGHPIGEKLDTRALDATYAGIVSLWTCYLCLVAHVLIFVLQRVLDRKSQPSAA